MLPTAWMSVPFSYVEPAIATAKNEWPVVQDEPLAPIVEKFVRELNRGR